VTRTPLRRRFDLREKTLTLSLIVGTAWLRLRLLGYTEMWGDQALTLNAALEWVHGGPLPLASMKSSFGVFNPPLVEYLYALPLFFSTHLLGVVWLVALVNLAGVLAAGWAAARVLGWRAAWWATLLFAVNPWAVYYGRLIWMQSFVPGFAALTLAFVLLYFCYQPRAYYLAGAAVCLSAVIQVHLTAVVLVPVLLVVAVVFRSQVRAAHLLAAAGVFAVTWLPFMLFEVRNNFVDWHALRTGLGLPAQVSAASLLILLDLLHGRGSLATLFLPAEQRAAFEGPLPLAWIAGPVLAAAVAVAGVNVVRGWREMGASTSQHAASATVSPAAENDSRRADFVLLLWTLVPVIFYLRHNQYLQNYYLLYVLPAPFLLMARLADRFYRWLRALWPHAARSGFWLPVLAFAPLALIAAQQARLDVLGQNRLASGEAGRQRVMDVQAAIDLSRALLAERPDCALVVMSNGAQFEASRFALLREFTRLGADPPRTRFVSAAEGRLLPSPCAVFLEAEANPEALAWLAEVAAPLPAATVQTPAETWRFYDLPAQAREAAAQLPAGAPLGQWSNGLALRQAHVEGVLEPSGQLAVRLVWAVEQPAPPRTIHFGVYMLGQPGTLVAQADGPGVDSTEWRTGDLFVTNFAVPLPPDLAPGEYEMAAALYYYPEIERLLLADGADLLYLARLAYPSTGG